MGGDERERASHVVNAGCVCCRAAGGTGKENGFRLWGRRDGGKPWFPVPQIPSSCLQSRYTKPPLKVLETGGGMKRSH